MLQEISEARESTQKEISRRDQSIEELRQQLEAIRSQSREEQDQHQEERSSLTHNVSHLQSENERLKADCVNLEEKIEIMSGKSKGQVEELQSQLSCWQDKYQQSVHDNQKSTEHVSRVTSDNKKLQSELENLQMASLEKEQTMKKELNRMEQTKNDFESRLQQEINFHQEQLRQHEVASEQNQKINGEVLMLRQQLKHREAELQTVREEVQKKQDTLEEIGKLVARSRL
jgi:chromosome segregation ATPase